MCYAVLTECNTHTKVKKERHRKSEFGSSVSPQTISHAVTTENRVKCDHVQGKFAYAINMYCEIVLNNS